MGSSCAQLYLRCRTLFCSETVASTWQCYTSVRHCTMVTGVAPKILNGSLFFSGNHRTVQAAQRWKQQIFLMVKHLSTEEDKFTEKLSRTDFVHRNAVLVSNSETSLDLDDAGEFSALEEISDTEAVSIYVPPTLPPASTSLRDYVDKSEVLTKLVQLGVNLWKLEQRPNVGSMLLRLDFNADVAPRLLFLKEIGVEDSHLGYIITHNPFILTQSLESLQTRVNYLISKKFGPKIVASMVSKAPYLLNFSVKRLHNRLGFYQEQLNLSASNTRSVIARLPKLLCGSLEPVKENMKVCEIELGFKKNEIQHIVIAVPKVLITNKRKLTQIFDLVHNTMKVPHHLLTKFPQVLNTSYLRLRERHLFLKYLGKDQYDPALPNYISLDRLVTLPDETFCTELASATMEDLNLFLKTI